jgi:CheY-like chemotaxis protein
MSVLTGRKVLVVEDEFLIASVLCDMLEDSGAVVFGPATTVAEAIRLLQENPVEAALLDMNLNGVWSDPVAEALQERRIPFVFTTGYGANSRTEKFGVRTVSKPYSWEEIEQQLGLSMVEASLRPE